MGLAKSVNFFPWGSLPLKRAVVPHPGKKYSVIN